jgi:hypothetical protein
MYRLINDLRLHPKAELVFAFGQFVHFTGVDDDIETIELDRYLEKLEHENVIAEEVMPGIEDVFMGLSRIA